MPTYTFRLIEHIDELEHGGTSRDAMVTAPNPERAMGLLFESITASGSEYDVDWDTWHRLPHGSVLVAVGGELRDLSAFSALQQKIAAIEAGE